MQRRLQDANKKHLRLLKKRKLQVPTKRPLVVKKLRQAGAEEVAFKKRSRQEMISRQHRTKDLQENQELTMDSCFQGQASDKKSLSLLKKKRDAHQGKKKVTMAKDSASATNM